MSPRLLTLNGLSDEIILLIFEQVFRADRKALLSLCRSCQCFTPLATSILYRSVSIWPAFLSRPTPQSGPAAWYTYRSNVIIYCRQIVIEVPGSWEILADVISQMKYLESVWWIYDPYYWVVPFPDIINDSLQIYWPNAKLYIDRLPVGHCTDNGEVQRQDQKVLKSLVGVPNIASFKVEITYEHPISMRWLKDIFLSCRKLKVLHITVPEDRRRDTDWVADGFGVYDLSVQAGDKLVPLETLIYESRHQFRTDKAIIPPSFFDWSQIRHLELRGQRMMQFLELLYLEKLTLDKLVIEFCFLTRFYQEGVHVLDNFLSRLQNLKTVHLVNPLKQIPISTITLQGETLQNLIIRHPRASCDPYSVVPNAQPYSAQDLDILQAACPNLTFLTLDMGINDDMPYDFLAALGRFPKVHTVRIYVCFNLLYNGRKAPGLPNIKTDNLTVRHMFTYLLRCKTGCGLRRLEVILGDPVGRRAPGYDERPYVVFICQQDGQGNVVVTTDPVSRRLESWWDFYYRKISPSQPRGQTFPPNLEETLEANQVIERADAKISMDCIIQELPTYMDLRD